MKVSLLLFLLLTGTVVAEAQKRRSPAKARTAAATATRAAEIGKTAVVADETLSVLRQKPSLYAEAVQRMRRGRKVKITAVTEADGVRFYKVIALPSTQGWVQAEAVFGTFRPNDDQRLASLVQALSGFDQLEAASTFLDIYPDSVLRPKILLLYGDLLEDTAAKLSKDASSKLRRTEMAATAAPMHSYFLNYVSLDRYRKLGIRFIFNSQTRLYHYDGAAWAEIVRRFPESGEATDARQRLDMLQRNTANAAGQ